VVGQGTTFSIKLFLPQVRANEVARQTPRGQRTGYVGERRRIWVVDNEEADRGLLLRVLEPIGFEVTTLASGLDCLEALRRCPPHQLPHALFMDLAMPGLDGWGTLRAIRKEGLTAAPAAIVSANAFDKALDNDVGITPEDFIVKPVRVAELLDWLGRQLDLKWIEAQHLPLVTLVQGAGVLHAEQSAQQALPSLESLHQLEDQVRAGYVRGVHRALDQMAAQEPACEPFVLGLRQLARQFQLDALAAQVQEAIRIRGAALSPQG
jgi:CheY-like chemotaxis protein